MADYNFLIDDNFHLYKNNGLRIHTLYATNGEEIDKNVKIMSF